MPSFTDTYYFDLGAIDLNADLSYDWLFANGPGEFGVGGLVAWKDMRLSQWDRARFSFSVALDFNVTGGTGTYTFDSTFDSYDGPGTSATPHTVSLPPTGRGGSGSASDSAGSISTWQLPANIPASSSAVSGDVFDSLYNWHLDMPAWGVAATALDFVLQVVVTYEVDDTPPPPPPTTWHTGIVAMAGEAVLGH